MRRLKEKRLGVALCWGLLCGVVGSGRLQAQERALDVVVLEVRGQPQPGLVSALRIQLTGSWPLEVREVPAALGLSARLSAAHALAEGGQTLAVVWVELGEPAPDGSRQALVYVVGRRAGRAIVQVVEVPGGRGPDLERSLALKIGELLDELSRGDESGRYARLLGPNPADAPPTAANERDLRSPEGWATVVRAGARFAFSSGQGLWRSGLGIEAGPSVQSGRWVTTLAAGVDWFPPAHFSRDGSGVAISEWTPQLTAALQYEFDALSIAARSGAGYELLRANGQTASGQRGSADGQSLAWLLGIGIEYAFGAGLSLAAAGDLLLQATRQRFDVNERNVVDLSRAQLRWSIDLVYRFP